MHFLYPNFLWALLCCFIPVIIHYINFRRHKTVYFSNVAFLKHIKKEHKKRSRLREILILLARTLTIASIVLLFAQPFVPSKNNDTRRSIKNVVVFIDNSLSMQASTVSGSALESAKQQAIAVIKTFPKQTNFLILTNSNESQYNTFCNGKQAVEQVSDIQFSSTITNYKTTRAQLATHIEKSNTDSNHTALYYFSDFQRTSRLQKQTEQTDSLAQTHWIPISINQRSNITIDTCYFDTPVRKLSGNENLTVVISNKSDETFTDIPIQLHINQELKASGALTIEANQTQKMKLSFSYNSPGWKFCKISLSDYPIVFDNNFYQSYFVAPKIKTLEITQAEKQETNRHFLAMLFNTDSLINFETVASNKLPYGYLNKFEAVYLTNLQQISNSLRSQLVKFVEKGGSLAIFPNKDCNLSSFNSLLAQLKCNPLSPIDSTSQQLIKNINRDNMLFRSVFEDYKSNTLLPLVKAFFPIKRTANIVSNPIMMLNSNQWVASTTLLGKGKVYTFGFPLDDESTNFATHPIAVPVLYNIASNSQYSGTLQYSTLAQRISLPIDITITNTSDIKIQNQTTQSEFLPLNIFARGNQLEANLDKTYNAPGHFRLFQGNRPLAGYSMNMDRDESELNYYSTKELKQIAEQINNTTVLNFKDANSTQITELINHGKQLWRYLLIFAIIFILSEALIIRFWKQ